MRKHLVRSTISKLSFCLVLMCSWFHLIGTVEAVRYTFENVYEPGEYRLGTGSINNHGDVAFYGFDGEKLGVFVREEGREVVPIVESDSEVGFVDFRYPDINDHGDLVFFAESAKEIDGIYRLRDGVVEPVAVLDDEFIRFRPLGLTPNLDPARPKINNKGEIAFFAIAADRRDGSLFEGIFSGPDPLTDLWVHGNQEGVAGFLFPEFVQSFDINDRGEIGFGTNVLVTDPKDGSMVYTSAIMKGIPPDLEELAAGHCEFIGGFCLDIDSPFEYFAGIYDINASGDVAFSQGYTNGDKIIRPEHPESSIGFLDDKGVPYLESALGPNRKGLLAGDHPIADLVLEFGVSTIDGRLVEFAKILDVSGNGKILLSHNRTLVIATPHPVPLGDFDNDTFLTAVDIDVLSESVLAGLETPRFDVDGSGEVDTSDRLYWIEKLAGSLLGDANLDKKVDFEDFLHLSVNFDQTAGWDSGDFLGDGRVGFDDFLVLTENFGLTSADVRAVPEPNVPLFFSVLFLATIARRSNVARLAPLRKTIA